MTCSAELRILLSSPGGCTITLSCLNGLLQLGWLNLQNPEDVKKVRERLRVALRLTTSRPRCLHGDALRPWAPSHTLALGVVPHCLRRKVPPCTPWH